MSIASSDGTNIKLRGRKARAVLAVLTLSSQPVLRDTLLKKLWSDRERYNAQSSLRQSVYEIQEAFRTLDHTLFYTERNYLKLNHNMLSVDVKSVRNATIQNPKALALIKGDLLEDLSGIDPAFDIWLEGERQDILKHARGIAEAVINSASGPDRMIVAAQYILTIDVTLGHVWQVLIDNLLTLGQTDAAKVADDRRRLILNHSERNRLVTKSGLTVLSSQPISHAERYIHNIHKNDDKHISSGINIAVGQFEALDSESRRLAKGLTEEVRFLLSKFRGISCFFLININDNIGMSGALNSTKPNLDFIIEGSIQQNSSELKITVHLADVRNFGEIVWSQRFDRELAETLVIQSEVASKIVAQIDPQLMKRESQRAESRKGNTSTSLEYVLRAIPAIYRLNRTEFLDAGILLELAIAQDPTNGAAHAWWAYWHLLLLGQGWADDPLDAENRTWELAERAVALDPGDARALALAGHVQAFTHRRLDEAMMLHDRALSINPNLPIAWLFSGLAHSYAGLHGEAIRRIRHAKKLSPLDPHAFFFEMGLTLSLSLSGDDHEAVEHGRNAASINPSFSSTFKAYLSALGFVGNEEVKGRTLAHLLKLEPTLSLASALKRSPLIRHVDREKFIEGLRLGGLS